jgi:drug/metabolite transporter (DMT)-like permease
MGDPEFGRYKAFFFVGIAYLLTAVLAPAGLLVARGAEWSFTGPGVGWSLMAGVVGAAGAFSVLLAFGAKGTPAVVMSLVFAGAPIVNAIVSVAMHNLWAHVRWPFVLGIAMAAMGAYLVVNFKPTPAAEGVKAAQGGSSATG